MRKQDNHTFLTTAPIHRVIPAMAVPTIISMLVTSIYNLVDTYFVGLINTQATAAVGAGENVTIELPPVTLQNFENNAEDTERLLVTP